MRPPLEVQAAFDDVLKAGQSASAPERGRGLCQRGRAARQGTASRLPRRPRLQGPHRRAGRGRRSASGWCRPNTPKRRRSRAIACTRRHAAGLRQREQGAGRQQAGPNMPYFAARQAMQLSAQGEARAQQPAAQAPAAVPAAGRRRFRQRPIARSCDSDRSRERDAR